VINYSFASFNQILLEEVSPYCIPSELYDGASSILLVDYNSAKNKTIEQNQKLQEKQ
jgi:hypothetical protein